MSFVGSADLITTAPPLTSIIRLQFPLTNNFNQRTCLTTRDVAAFWHRQHANCCFAIAQSDDDFVFRFNGVRRFRPPPIEQNKTRVTKLLSY